MILSYTAMADVSQTQQTLLFSLFSVCRHCMYWFTKDLFRCSEFGTLVARYIILLCDRTAFFRASLAELIRSLPIYQKGFKVVFMCAASRHHRLFCELKLARSNPIYTGQMDAKCPLDTHFSRFWPYGILKNPQKKKLQCFDFVIHISYSRHARLHRHQILVRSMKIWCVKYACRWKQWSLAMLKGNLPKFRDGTLLLHGISPWCYELESCALSCGIWKWMHLLAVGSFNSNKQFYIPIQATHPS